MQIINKVVPKTEDDSPIQIMLFYDTHLGSTKCDIAELRSRIAYVRDTPNCYAILGGDLINNSTKTSVGDVYSEPLTPQQQVELAVRTFDPIKDKILGICAGNHERRTRKLDGIDVVQLIAWQLDVEDVYDYTSILLFLRTTNKESHAPMYTIYFTHGDGNGGRTIGGKANGLLRRGQIVDADIIIAGHTHQPFCTREVSYQINRTHQCVVEHEQVYVNAGATLDYEEYAELYGMKPSSKANPKIILGTKDYNIQVMM